MPRTGHRDRPNGFAGLGGDGKIPASLLPSSSGATLYSETVPFTDGDTSRRVSILNASVVPTSLVVASARRPDSASDSADKGYVYVVTVVRVYSGGFDAIVACLDFGGMDPADDPPNENVQVHYLIG